jgi:predicted enzyme related to lactoylglutathione lyase
MAEFTSYVHGTPCWVDVTSTDMARTVSFYGDLFGWEAETAAEPEAGGYTMFRLRGKNVAAASPPPPASPQASYWTTYLASDDVDDTAARIREAGGTVLMEPFDVFDAGRMTVAQDPTGATFGIWQANTMIGAELANEPGTLNWNQCQTPDPARAAEFYAAALGFGIDAVDVGTAEPFRVLQVEGKPVAGVREPIPQMGDAPQWSVVFSVANTDETVAKAQELGGEILLEPTDLPQIGRIAVLRDPVGATFQVIQPPPDA